MLFNSVILEVAISLFLLFLVTSLICSGINELFAGATQLRAKNLRHGIKTLLNDNQALLDVFYNNTLIKGLSPEGSKGPSYIPAFVFARVLREVLTRDSIDELPPKDWNEVLSNLLRKPQSELSVTQREVLGVLQTSGLDPARLTKLTELNTQLNGARLALKAFSESGNKAEGPAGEFFLQQVMLLEKSVQQIEKEASDALQQAQINVERYFNDAMDRVSGWYKRHTQKLLILFAVIPTLLFNIDAIAITNTLFRAPATRAVLIQIAEAQVASGEEQMNLQKTLDEIAGAGLNLGWNRCEIPESISGPAECPESTARPITQPLQWLSGKLLGFILTIFAVSLGAPFWFDLLNKAVNLRMAGKQPSEELSTEKQAPE